VIRVNSPLHREIGNAIFVVVMDTGADAVGTADCQAGGRGTAVLDHSKEGLAILV